MQKKFILTLLSLIIIVSTSVMAENDNTENISSDTSDSIHQEQQDVPALDSDNMVVPPDANMPDGAPVTIPETDFGMPDSNGSQRPDGNFTPRDNQGGFTPPQNRTNASQGQFQPPQNGSFPGQGQFQPPQNGSFPGQGQFQPPQNGSFPGQGRFQPPQNGSFPRQGEFSTADNNSMDTMVQSDGKPFADPSQIPNGNQQFGGQMPGGMRGFSGNMQNYNMNQANNPKGFWGFLKTYSTPVFSVILLALAYVFVIFYKRKNY